MLALVMISGSIFMAEEGFAETLQDAETFQDYEAYAAQFANSKSESVTGSNMETTLQTELIPNAKDVEFIQKHKDKYPFLSEEDILSVSKENFDSKVSAGKVENPNAIDNKNLNQASTAKSLNKDDKDKSQTSSNEYLDIAIKTDEDQRRYKKDLEEKQIKDSIGIISDPGKTLKEKFGMDPDCNEEKDDVQDSLNPKITEYKTTEQSKETIEDHKSCEESEPVPFKCERKLKLTCERSKECDNGGIILSSVKTNLQQQSYSYPTLYVGTPHWAPYYCSKDDTKYTTFEVKNLEKVKSVILTRVMFDDHLLIKVNGQKVYLGPEDDGDRLDVLEGSRNGVITTNGSNRKICERATNWNRSPNIDLKPYLKDGENTISITIVTAGYGNAQVWINAVQYCCDKWIETWEDVCEKELKELQ